MITATRPANTMAKLFGTDGIRGEAGSPPLTPETLLKIGRAIAKCLGQDAGRVVFGDDGRRSAAMIRAALGAGLTASGFDVVDVGLVTTPGLSYLTRTQGFDLGIMISASHNPASDNGIKLFANSGFKIDDEIEGAITQCVAEDDGTHAASTSIGRSHTAHELVQQYASALQKGCPNLDLTGLKIGLDCANGAGSNLARKVLEEKGAEVIAMASTPDGDNINAHSGAVHPEYLQQFMQDEGCRVGFALDGDGDRIMLVDEEGKIVDGDAVLYALGAHLKENGTLPGNTIVTTVMSNLGLRVALDALQIETLPVAVGDRNVVKGMQEHGFALGGEPSGHIIMAEGHFTGDESLRLSDSSRSCSKRERAWPS